ncbi:ImmA/IrrE family metallo-endopeptidase [Corynebacterium kalidii]
MTTTITDLHIICEILNIHRRHHDTGPLGWYQPGPPKTISTKKGLRIWDYKTVLAHEIGHAAYNDNACTGRWKDKQEQRANRLAARLLIDPGDLQEATLWHRDDHHALALDLEVAPHLLDVFMTHNTQEMR